MSDEIERVPMTNLEKLADDLRKRERTMSTNDELVHLEVQGVIREQHAQSEHLARLQIDFDRMGDVLMAVVLDRDALVFAYNKTVAELQQIRVHQSATDARLDVLASVFEVGRKKIEEVVEETAHLMKSVADKTEP